MLISLLFCLSAFAYWLIPTRLPTITCWISGGILLAYGIIRILGFFSDDPYCLAFHYDLACGLLLMVLGGIVWIALLDSFFKIQMSKEAKDFGLQEWRFILCVAILTASSSFFLVLNDFLGPQVTKLLMGSTLLLEGILNWFTVKFTVK